MTWVGDLDTCVDCEKGTRKAGVTDLTLGCRRGAWTRVGSLVHGRLGRVGAPWTNCQGM